MTKIVPVILAGGSGTRLWPLSRQLFPKQFHSFVDDNSLFQNTVERVKPLMERADTGPVVVCNQDHYFICAEQLVAMGVEDYHLMVEPCGRNSAPAVLAAALYARDLYGDDSLIMVLPSDHAIPGAEAFGEIVLDAARICETSRLLMTFGIKPMHAETGYGYIRQGGALEGRAARVAAFTEKPNRETAAEFLVSGDYLWNSGMFMFPSELLIAEMHRHAPEISSAVAAAYARAAEHGDYCRLGADEFSACPEDSIDYALMEKTDRAAVMPFEIDWTDLGGWRAVHEQGADKDEHNNVLMGEALVHDTENTLVVSDNHLVATVGVKDHVIVHTDDATLVAHRDAVQSVKEITNMLKSNGDHRAKHGSRVYRPWGFYESIAMSDGFQVKRIRVNPGAKLSLQMHHHRAEHWIVVRGHAEVVNGDQILQLKANESTYIPQQAKHRMSNPGEEPLDVIEVQYGSYLGEDDIVRFEDVYGRAESAEPVA